MATAIFDAAAKFSNVIGVPLVAVTNVAHGWRWGAAAPPVTGLMVGATNACANAFPVAGVILIVGIVSFVFVLGKVEPVPDPEPASALSATARP